MGGRGFLVVIGLLIAVVSCTEDKRDVTVKCPYAECSCTDTVIDCSGHIFQKIPPLVNGHSTFLTTLKLDHNNISSIEDDSLPANLHMIDLRWNPLVNISASAFAASANTLHIIRFSNADFTEVPEALAGLRNLERLEISDTTIRSWPTQVIQALGSSVFDLKLSNNGFSKFPAELTFANFPKLSILDLSFNRIGALTESSLAPWGRQLTNLTVVSTSQTSAKFLHNMEAVHYLDLRKNRLSDHESLLHELAPAEKMLEYLDLSENLFTTMPRLANFDSLKEVSFSANKLKTESGFDLPNSVQVLHLENNEFAEIPNFISKLSNLDYLNLYSNKLARIGSGKFPQNSKLQWLVLGDNPIASVDGNAFQNLKKLGWLSMSFTQLTSLPLALQSLTGLHTLWLPGNANLECTCDEKPLSDWFIAHPMMSVIGQCGTQDIKEYFTSIAPVVCP